MKHYFFKIFCFRLSKTWFQVVLSVIICYTYSTAKVSSAQIKCF